MPGETHVPDEYTCWGVGEAELCYLWLSQADFSLGLSINQEPFMHLIN